MPKKPLPVYTIGEFQHIQEGRDFYANRIPSHLRDHHFIHHPHRHDFFLVVLFTHGSGTHEIDFSTYPVKPGSLFLMSPGQMHNWKLSGDVDGYVFFHTEEFYNLNFAARKVKDYPFFASDYNSPLLQLKKKELKKTQRYLMEILEEYKKDKALKFQKICAWLDLFYIELARYYPPGKEAGKQPAGYAGKLRQLEELIDKRFREIKSPAEYAGMMNMSEKHLNRICKALLNKTSTELISDRVILEAKRMLVHAQQTVAEVAADLGYFDASYFTRLFKKKNGKTPVEFMNKYKQAQEKVKIQKGPGRKN